MYTVKTVEDLISSMDKFTSISIRIETHTASMATWFPILCNKLPNSELKELDLSWNPILDQGVKKIAKILPVCNLVKLNLKATNSGNEGVKAIASTLPNSKLTYLNLGWNCQIDDGLHALVNALPQSNLTFLSLKSNGNIKDFGSVMRVLPQSSLTQLNLSMNQIAHDDVMVITQFLSQSRLKWLNLSRCYINEIQHRAFIDSLQTNVCLEELVGIKNNEITDLLKPEARQLRYNRLMGTKSARNLIPHN